MKYHLQIQKKKEEQERKRKEAEEARKRQEEERKRQEEEKKADPVPQPPAEDFMNPPEPEVKEYPLIYPVMFRAYMTEMQSQELGRWFTERNIKFEPIR